MTENTQEIYDIIMNDERCYIHFKDKKFKAEIRYAEILSDEYGHKIKLTQSEKNDLVFDLENEWNNYNYIEWLKS